jgi:vancomycin resistance protein YoaR
MQQPVTLRFNDRTWQPTLRELGVSLDLDQSLDQAFAIGHTGSEFDALRHALHLAQPTNLPLRIVVDGSTLDSYLQTIADEVEVAPQEATLTIVNGQARTTPSQNGAVLLREETAAAIVNGLQQAQPQNVEIQLQTVVPPVTTEHVAEAERAVQTIVGTPLELVAGSQTFTISSQTLTALLRVERVERDGSVTLRTVLDRTKLESFVRDITAQVGQAPVEPRLNWNNGQLEIFKPGAPGVGVDMARAVEAVNTAILTQNRRVELPVETIQPEVSPETLASLGIKELVGEGTSYFLNSAEYRITNISAGIALLHGVLIAPGAEFSFNDTVGDDLDERTGFVQGEAIVGNKVVIEYGGGICQDSTTVYRAAFYAGLPITERTSHSSRLDFYEVGETVGMDAAIFTEIGPDLKFRNDTDHWLLMQGEVDLVTQQVAVRLYGTKVEGRSVERSEPVISYGENGVTLVSVTRTIKQDGNVVSTEEFPSRFQPLTAAQISN